MRVHCASSGSPGMAYMRLVGSIRDAHWAFFPILALCNCSDSDSSVQTIKDSTGLTVSWECPEGDACDMAGDTPCGGSPTSSGGRIFAVCIAKDDLVTGISCRPVVCAGDVDCPNYHEFTNYRCIEGWCQDDGVPLGDFDVAAACLSAVERSPDDCQPELDPDALEEKLALIDQVCGEQASSCSEMPAECR